MSLSHDGGQKEGYHSGFSVVLFFFNFYIYLFFSFLIVVSLNMYRSCQKRLRFSFFAMVLQLFFSFSVALLPLSPSLHAPPLLLPSLLLLRFQILSLPGLFSFSVCLFFSFLSLSVCCSRNAQNKVHNNKGVGIKVTSRENPVFVENKIYANSHFGIHVHDNGVATVEKNEILDDELACVRVEGKGVLHCRKNLITGGLRSGVLVTDEGRIFMEGDVVKHHKRSSVEIQSTGVGSEPSTEISSPGSDRSKSAVLPTVSRLRNCLISAGSEAALLVCNNGKCSVVECRLENTTSTAAVVIVEQGGSLQLENSQVDAQSSKDAFYVDDESVLKQVGVNVREILSKAGSDESKTASGEAKAAEE